MRKEAPRLLALALWCAACASPRQESPTPLRPTSIPISTATAISIATLAEIDLPTSTAVIPTATDLLPPTETKIEKPPFMSGEINLSQNFTVQPPKDLNMPAIDVIALPQTLSSGWDKVKVAKFVNLEEPDNRRSCMVLKTDLPGVTMLVCHSFWFDDKELPFHWLERLGQDIVGMEIPFGQNGITQPYLATDSLHISEKFASPVLNGEAYRQQAGGMYVNTDGITGLHIPESIRQRLANNGGIIVQVCGGWFYTNNEGPGFTQRRHVILTGT